ncbi:MAG: MBL fold metallo-hydrolase [Chloroflexota bacterium]
MTEIIPGIYQLKVPIPNNPLGNTNSYLLKGDDGYLIIDPGMNHDESFAALGKELTAIGVAFEEITRILATHSHGDHYGLAGRIKKLSNATIIVHQTARDNMQFMAQHRQGRGEEMEKWLLLNGVPKSDPAELQRGPGGAQRGGPQGGGPRPPQFPEPTMPDVLLQGGETINVGSFSLEVLFTPGHDPGHICLYESTHKILFSGDHVLPGITPSVGLQTDSALNPLGNFLNSLNAVKHLDVTLVLPAHEQTFTDLKGRVDEIIAHHAHRDAEIMAAMNGEARTAYEISTVITWMPSLGGKKFAELGPWDKRMAVMETLAHLKVMKDSGKVGTILKDSTVYYHGNGKTIK